MPSKAFITEKYGFNPERDSVILRLPLGISLINDPDHFVKMLKLLLEATLEDVKIETDMVRTRLLIKPIHYFGEGAKSILTSWISSLIMNPNPNKVRDELPNIPERYTLTLFHDGVVYKNIYPMSNIVNDDGYYEFSFYGHLKV